MSNKIPVGVSCHTHCPYRATRQPCKDSSRALSEAHVWMGVQTGEVTQETTRQTVASAGSLAVPKHCLWRPLVPGGGLDGKLRRCRPGDGAGWNCCPAGRSTGQAMRVRLRQGNQPLVNWVHQTLTRMLGFLKFVALVSVQVHAPLVAGWSVHACCSSGLVILVTQAIPVWSGGRQHVAPLRHRQAGGRSLARLVSPCFVIFFTRCWKYIPGMCRAFV